MINFRTFFVSAAIVTACSMAAFAEVPSQNIPVSLRDVIDTVEKSFSSEAESRYSDDTIFLYDVSADFVQRTIMAGKDGGREMRADGEFLLKNADYRKREPLKFSFEYFRPTRHQILSDGASLWTWLPENRQVILSDMTSFFEPQFADPSRNKGFNFLQGLPRISKDFLIIYSPQGRDMNGNYILELSPRRPMETVEKLFIVVNKDSVTRYVQYNKRHIINPDQKGNRGKDLQQFAFPILSTTVIDHKGNATTLEFSNTRPNIGLPDMLFTFDIPANVQTVRPPGSR